VVPFAILLPATELSTDGEREYWGVDAPDAPLVSGAKELRRFEGLRFLFGAPELPAMEGRLRGTLRVGICGGEAMLVWCFVVASCLEA
jgi:hypothetical protein